MSNNNYQNNNQFGHNNQNGNPNNNYNQQNYYQGNYNNQQQQQYQQQYQQPNMQNNMYQTNQLGQQLKNSRKKNPKFNLKIIGIIVGILVLGIGGYFAYDRFFNVPSIDEFTNAQKVGLAYQEKFDRLADSDDELRKLFLNDFTESYLDIMNTNADSPGIDLSMTKINTDIAILSESIKNTDGAEREELIKEFDKLIGQSKSSVSYKRMVVSETLSKWIPYFEPRTAAEKKAHELLLSGYKEYSAFLTLYEQYLNNPSETVLNKALEKQYNAKKTLTLAFIEYVLDEE